MVQGVGCIWARRMAWDPDCPRPAPVHPRRDPTTKLSTGQWSLQNQLCLWLPSQHSLLHSRDRAGLLGGHEINESRSQLPGWLSHSVMLGVLGRELCCWGDLHLTGQQPPDRTCPIAQLSPCLCNCPWSWPVVLSGLGTSRCPVDFNRSANVVCTTPSEHIHLAEAGEWL